MTQEMLPAQGHTVVTLRATGQPAVTVTGQSATFTNSQFSRAVFNLVVTAVTGTTPTLVVKIQGADPLTPTRFYDIPGAAFASQNAVTAANTALQLSIGPALPVTAGVSANAMLPRLYRAVWTIGGTLPNFTFSLVATLMV